MCGIAGIYTASGLEPSARERLEAMTGELGHRGPDHEAWLFDEVVGLGYRRLAIIDAAGGAQPFVAAGGAVSMICNAEIYNHRGLRSELEGRGHRFRSRCDVEVLVHAYVEWGRGFLDHVEGQFALAIYDRRERALLLARDRFGVCPLYLTWIGTSLLFGSEIKALLAHPGVDRRVDLNGLDQLLCFAAQIDPVTMFASVRSLPPGHGLWVDEHAAEQFCYWDLDYPRIADARARPDTHQDQLVLELERALSTAVAARLEADVPVGLYLSGGLDSSLVGALARAAQPKLPLRSYAISFPDDHGIDERRYQTLAAEHIGAIHTDVPMRLADIEARLATMIIHAERPTSETYNACSLALAEAAEADGVRVVLCGEGADELFAGYLGYLFDRRRAAAPLDDDLDAALERETNTRLWGAPELSYEPLGPTTVEDLRSIYSPSLAAALGEQGCLAAPPVDRRMLDGRAPVHQRSYLDFKIRLAGHLVADHGDRMAYARSVEARYPFLDRGVVELVRSFDPEFKLRGDVDKYILRRLAAAHLPAAIHERPKFGFVAPGSAALLRAGSELFEDTLAHDRIVRHGYFDPEVIERIKHHHRRSDRALHPAYERDLLMLVFSFELWLDHFGAPNHG